MILSPNRRLIIVLISIPVVLLILFVAMQITNEIDWSLTDFLILGGLLLGTALIIEIILRNVRSKRQRMILAVIAVLLLLISWVEIAVGLFGTPFGGS